MLFVFIACTSSNTEKQYTGSELMEMYYDSTCQLYVQPDCITEFANCNTPVSVYTDWADCMNYMNSSFSHCGILESLFEENQSLVVECVEQLQELECINDDICPEGETVLQSGTCGDVLTILMSNCSPF